MVIAVEFFAFVYVVIPHSESVSFDDVWERPSFLQTKHVSLQSKTAAFVEHSIFPKEACCFPIKVGISPL
jgi:hypothetical protein